ncbi:MAG: type IV pilus assembly protein FimV [Gammaproteobacteria bacterium]
MKFNSPTRSTLTLCVLGALSNGYSNSADAFQLGQLQEASRLGEPLDAYINVLLSPTDARKVTDVAVIPDFSYRNDPVMNAALSTIRAELVSNSYGNHYIKLTSSAELSLPVLAFRIKATNGDNTLIRSFSVAPAQAVPAIVQQPNVTGRSRDFTATSTRRKTTRTNTTTQTPATPPTAPGIVGNEYGPVKAGDTLWKIATQVAGAGAGGLLNQLFELNPHAFIGGDINKLKQGVTLTLPTAFATAQNIDSVEAATAGPSSVPTATAAEQISPTFEEMLDAENAIADEANEETAESVFADLDSAAATNSNAVENIQINTPANVGISTARTPVDWRGENPEVAEKLSELSAKYAALRARYSEQVANSGESTRLISEPTPTESVTVTEQQEAAAAPTITEEQEAGLDQAEIATEFTAADFEDEGGFDSAAVSPDVAAPRFQLPMWAVGLLGLMLLIGSAGYYLRRVRVAFAVKQEEQQRKQKDNSLKEEMAKKVQHRVRMEDEVERMSQETIVDETSESEKTLQLSVEDLMPDPANAVEIDLSDDDSAENKINDSIAHGRYIEAEEMLREVINDSPRNFSAKLRLAEVYYITERIDDFVQISQDIHANHRPDISDEDWRRVMRMGKMIAPGQPPFSGPQSIMDDASAG